MATGAPSISVRKFYRRNDDPPEEKKSVLVLTSKAKYYVDIRVHLTPEGAFPSTFGRAEDVKKLDWAFAGTSKTTPPVYEADVLKKPSHTVWLHWIDSETTDEVNDEGDMIPQPDGTVLEKGVNRDPATGAIINTYEESWLDLDAKVIGREEQRVCLVLRVDQPSRLVKGMVIRIGQYIQGILKIGDEITLARWHWLVDEEKWKLTLEIGSGKDMIPCEAISGFLVTGMSVGQTVPAKNELDWTCIEAFLW